MRFAQCHTERNSSATPLPPADHATGLRPAFHVLPATLLSTNTRTGTASPMSQPAHATGACWALA
jgi:hypothetical protein